jgi:hypothetical protein
MVLVEGIEIITDFRKKDTGERVLAKRGVAEQVELEEEEFFELEAGLSLGEVLRGRGKVDVSKGLVARDELIVADEGVGESFREFGDGLKEGVLDILNGAGMEEGFFHGIGSIVERDKESGEMRCQVRWVKVGMRDREGMIEFIRFAEEDVIGIEFVFVEEEMDVMEPDEFKMIGAVGEDGFKSFGATGA